MKLLYLRNECIKQVHAQIRRGIVRDVKNVEEEIHTYDHTTNECFGVHQEWNWKGEGETEEIG